MNPKFIAASAILAATLVAFVAIRRHTRVRRERKALQLRHPAEPWKWSPHWESGEAQPAGGAQRAVFLGFGLVFTAMAAPLWFVVRQGLERGDYGNLLALILPAAGLLMLSAAAVAWLRQRRYGRATLRFTEPGALGGRFRGQLQISRGLDRLGHIDLTIHSVREYVSGTGKNRRTRRDYLWQDTREVPLHAMGGAGLIPVEFDIPYDADATDSTNPRDRIVWEVEATAPAPGLDYWERFEIPVFRIRDSDPERTSDVLRSESARRAAGRSDFRSFRVLSRGPETEVRIHRKQSLGIGIAMVLFGAIFTGVGAAFVLGSASTGGFFAAFLWLFVIVFGGMGLLILLMGLGQVFGKTRIILGGNAVRYDRRYAGLPGLSGTFRSGEIERVSLRQQAQSGGRIWYDIELHRPKPARAKRLACSIRHKPDAEWLAEEITRTLGHSRRMD